MSEPLYDYGDMIEGEKSRSMNLRIEMPRPYTPELTEKMIEILGLVREVVDSGWESLALVSVGVENMDKFIRLYDFDTVEPALWKGMRIWASHALPEGTFFIVYKGEPYIFYLPKFLPLFPEEEEEKVWTLNKEQRKAVLNHVETTLSAINERGSFGIPVAFVNQLHEIKEALG